MAITISQKPTSPNTAYTRLLYVVSGSQQTGSAQFQYVMDVYESGSTDLIKRTKQTINPAGVAVFDPSRIIQGELSEDQAWKISSVQEFQSSSKTFTIEFGEQFATSISSSATIYPNLVSDNIKVFRGIVEPNAGYFNWQSGSYAVLSNMPATQSMQVDDFGTISVYNNSVQYISESFYSASEGGDQLIQTKAYSVTKDFSNIPISASTPYWNYVDVEVSSSLGKQNYRYEVSDEIHREKVRFAFLNKYGTWDYYNNYNPVRQTINVTRQEYTAPRVDYSSVNSLYDISRRGKTVNNSKTNDSFTVQTNYLTKEDANWLEELIESPSVYIQRNGEFIPIIINNSSYTSKTSTGRQKLFNYTIEFTPSNQPFGTWIPEYVTCPAISTEAEPPVVLTLALSAFTTSSLTLNGNVTADNGESVVERGFAYSSQSALPDISSSDSTKVTVGSGLGTYNTEVGSLNNNTLYYARAYASNSAGIAYGEVKSGSTVSFDAYLGETLSPYLWFDFTNSTNMDLFDTNKIRSISNKGTYPLTLASMSNMSYPNDYVAPTWEGEYMTFNGVWRSGASTKRSDLGSYNSIQGTGSADAEIPLLTSGSAFTMLSFYRPKFTEDGTKSPFSSTTVTVAGYAAEAGNTLEEIEFIQMANHKDPIGNNFEFFSNTIPSASASISGSTAKFVFDTPANSQHGIFSYSGSSTEPWMSQVITYNGATPELNIYRTPSLKATFTSSLATNNGAGFPTYFALGSEPDKSQRSGPTADMSHFLLYPEVLSDSQVNKLISNFSSSVSFGNELNSIGS